MFDAAHSALVGGISLIISLIGLVVSLAGFGFTIKQLRNTKAATMAVEAALGSLRNRMSTFDYATECLRAAKGFEHAIQLMRAGNWLDAANRLLEAQSSLNRIANAEEGSAQIKAEARQVALQLLETAQALEESADKGIHFDSREVVLTLRKQINILELDSITVQRGLYNA